MKTWIIVAIFALLLVSCIFAVKALTSDNSTNIETTSKTCSAENCPYTNSGGCTATKNCGSPTCGAATGKTCGCGK
jgi:uncharacterized protein YcfL